MQLGFANVTQQHLGQNVVRCIAMDGKLPTPDDELLPGEKSRD